MTNSSQWDQGHLSQVQEDWWDATEEEELLGLGFGEGGDGSRICEDDGVRVDFRTISI